MSGTIRYPLFFEEKDGTLGAQMSLDAWQAILETTMCIPWSVDGRRGLLYCSRKSYEEALQELWTTLKRTPLLQQLIGGVTHLYDIDKDGVLHIPRAAAHFAGIRDKAFLIPLSKDRVLLQSEDQAEEKPKEGKLIQVEF